MKQLLQFSFILCALIWGLGTQISSAASDENDEKYRVFHPIDDPSGKVQQTLDLASKKEQLALIVLGANWCHDSRGLVKRFSHSKMQDVLSTHYQMAYIDVGKLEDRRDITQRFGQAHYFATPTVFIIDPKSGKLLNETTLKKWGMADNIPLKEYLDYFKEYASKAQSDIPPIGPAYQAQINMFAQFQGHRLNQAYEHLRPLMIEEEKGNTTEHFVEDWNAVREFRIKLQNDLAALKAQALKKAPLPLKLPNYQPFYWE